MLQPCIQVSLTLSRFIERLGVFILFAALSPTDITCGAVLNSPRDALNLLNSSKKSDQKKGLSKLIELSSANDPKALLAIADLHYEGRFLKKDLALTFKYTKQAADLNLPEAQNNLGFLFKTGTGTQKSLEQAFLYFQLSAKSGFPPALYNLGLAYENGEGTRENLIEAVDCFRKAANSSHLQSQVRLGKLYRKNQPTESVFWHRLAAAQGHPESQYEMGVAHETGKGADQNFSFAFEYFLKASKQNHPDANFRCGCMMRQGYGTVQDRVGSKNFFQKAADFGHLKATAVLSDTPTEKTRAQLETLAAQGNLNAVLSLAWSHYHEAETDSYIEAYAWFSIAAYEDDLKGIWARSLTANKLNLDQVIQGKKRAKQIRKLFNLHKTFPPKLPHQR